MQRHRENNKSGRIDHGRFMPGTPAARKLIALKSRFVRRAMPMMAEPEA
jgi:hypothetical protein